MFTIHHFFSFNCTCSLLNFRSIPVRKCYIASLPILHVVRVRKAMGLVNVNIDADWALCAFIVKAAVSCAHNTQAGLARVSLRRQIKFRGRGFHFSNQIRQRERLAECRGIEWPALYEKRADEKRWNTRVSLAKCQTRNVYISYW